MIAPMAQMFLFGTEIDYATGLIESGFRFNNPNVAEACGCGESIKFAGTLSVAVSAATRAFVLELFEDLGGVTARADDGRPRRSTATASIFALVDRRRAHLPQGDRRASPRRSPPRAPSSSPTRAPASAARMGYWTLPEAALDDPEAACDWARRALDAPIPAAFPRPRGASASRRGRSASGGPPDGPPQARRRKLEDERPRRLGRHARRARRRASRARLRRADLPAGDADRPPRRRRASRSAARTATRQASGAHTGDIAAEMLADAGAVAVIVGHSERRADHGETDALVARKAAAAWRAGPHRHRLRRRDRGRARRRPDPRRGRRAARRLDPRRRHRRAARRRLRAGLGDRHRPHPVARRDRRGPWLHARTPRRPLRRRRRRRRSACSTAARSSPATPPRSSPSPNVDGALVGGASLDGRRLRRRSSPPRELISPPCAPARAGAIR